MPYTVWSHGREIGETDLGFHRFTEGARSGWFQPNLEGQRLMPVIAAVLPAMQAYHCRDKSTDVGRRENHRPPSRPPELAAVIHAMERVASLKLELRQDDGSVVPTSMIGIQDCQQLLELSSVTTGAWTPDSDSELDDVEALAELDELSELTELEDDWDSDEPGGWQPDELDGYDALDAVLEPWRGKGPSLPESERYQIHVLLDDNYVIP